MSGHRLQQRAHRRHAHLNRGLFDPDTSTDDDWLTFLFPSDTSESTTSTSSSTSPIFPPFITTGVSDPFSTTADTLTTTSTTQSTSTSSSSSVLPTSTSTTSSIAQTTHALSSTTLTTHVTASATNAAASSTSSVAPTSATNAGKIVGAVGAGVVGLAAVLALISFFLRRMRRKDEDANIFDPSSFRRSAVLMQDPPTHEDTVAAGYTPRNPPTMTERRPATFGTMYGAPGPNHNGFSPVSPYGPPQYGYAPDPHTNPFMPLAPPIQSPFSPVDTTANPFNDTPTLSRMPSAAVTSPLSRQSTGHTNARDSATVHATEYVDLDRSSATPAYQVARAQYVEVSRKQSLDTQNETSADESAPPVPQKDAPAPAASSDEHSLDFDFPNPPSPALTTASKYGISTSPPVLPEISVRDSGYSFPSPALVSQFPSGVTDVAAVQTMTMKTGSGSSFPVTPSPMASSFQLTPGPDQKDFTSAESLSVPAAAHKRPETVYDIDEAYGGF